MSDLSGRTSARATLAHIYSMSNINKDIHSFHLAKFSYMLTNDRLSSNNDNRNLNFHKTLVF